MRRQPIVKSLTVVAALSACAVAAPTALAHTDIGPVGTNTAGPVTDQTYNVAPPDTSKAVVVAQQPSASTSDLRSPDAKAATADPGAPTYATPNVIKVGSDGGFEWGDAGIGAGSVLAIVALAGGGLLLVSRRRATHSGVPAATS